MERWNKPNLVEDGTKLDKPEATSTREMIRTFFHMAKANGHRSVVAVPLGCGAFRNPATHVAEIFGSVLAEFGPFFEEVVFAVIDDHNAYHQYNPLGNFAAFGLEMLKLGGRCVGDQGQDMTPEDLVQHASIMRYNSPQPKERRRHH